MTISTKNIQKTVNFLEMIPRLLHHGIQVERIGYINNKNEVIDRTFRLPSMVLVFSGSGILCEKGRKEKLQAPFMLWNLPGDQRSYWPETTWDELYVGYQANALKELTELLPENFFRKRLRPILYPADCMTIVKDLLEEMHHPSQRGAADRIDLLAQQLLLSVIAPKNKETLNHKERLLLQVTDFLEMHYIEAIDFRSLVTRFGVSYSTFQRCWRERYPFSPLQYLRKLRNSKAMDLLQDSNLSIGDVAQTLGFSNQFYFAKFFHQVNGMTPSEFRRKSRE